MYYVGEEKVERYRSTTRPIDKYVIGEILLAGMRILCKYKSLHPMRIQDISIVFGRSPSKPMIYIIFIVDKDEAEEFISSPVRWSPMLSPHDATPAVW